MQKTSRFIAGLLTICMIISTFNVTSFADETLETLEITEVEDIEDKDIEDKDIEDKDSEDKDFEDLQDEDEVITPVELIESANVFAALSMEGESVVPIYLDNSGEYSFEERAADLVARLTLQEKTAQLVSGARAIPRLGVGWWGYWGEALKGVSRMGNPTGSDNTLSNSVSYPTLLTQSQTWDPQIMHDIGTQIGQEAREMAEGNFRNLSFYSPCVQLLRDPRWGRADEVQGEDPFHGAEMAARYVTGMEGKDINGNVLDPRGYLQTITTIKHYVGNNTEHNRLNGSINVSERDLREYYTDIYRRIVAISDNGSLMNEYGRMNEVPVSVSAYLQDTLLRQTFGFDGFITTDCDSMGTVIATSGVASYAEFAWDGQANMSGGHAWRPRALPGLSTGTATAARNEAYPPADPKNAVIPGNGMIAFAAIAGTDMECQGGVTNAGNFNYAVGGPGAVADAVNSITPMGRLTENAYDILAHRLFTARMKLGEFDRHQGIVEPYNEARLRIEMDSNRGPGWVYEDADNGWLLRPGARTVTQDRKALARKAAADGIIMLKNDIVTHPISHSQQPLLPLNPAEAADPSQYKLAVIGYGAAPEMPFNGLSGMGASTSAIGYVSGTQDKLQGGYSARYLPDAFDQFVYPWVGIVNAIRQISPSMSVGDNLRYVRGTSTPNTAGTSTEKRNANELRQNDQSRAEIAEAAQWADIAVVYMYSDLQGSNEERDRHTGVLAASAEGTTYSTVTGRPGGLNNLAVTSGSAAPQGSAATTQHAMNIYSLYFSPAQLEMLHIALENNPNVIVVMEALNGSSHTEEFHIWLDADGKRVMNIGNDQYYNQTNPGLTRRDVPAMLSSSFYGQEKGNALADVMVGNVNPGARTTTLWHRFDQLTNMYSSRLAPGTDNLMNRRAANNTNVRAPIDSKGRTYMYFDEVAYGKPNFPFGYGLSYTTFHYSNFTISRATGGSEAVSINANPQDTLTISFDIRNTGNLRGSAVPQLYVKTPDAIRNGVNGERYPIKRLRGFEKIWLNAGEQRRMTLTVPVEEFAFFDESTMKFDVIPGLYPVQISDSSDDAHEHHVFHVHVAGAYTPSVSVVTAKPVTSKAEDADIPHMLLFDINDDIDPRLTIALSDQALYGHVNLKTQENTADYPFINPPTKHNYPGTMQITYTSNRPEVVQVIASGANGRLKARSHGVATITATVHDTVSGTTETGDFVIYVKEPEGEYDGRLLTLEINGKSVDGFDHEQTLYEFALPRGTQVAPVVTASALSGNTVMVSQAGSVPGIAYVRVSDSAGRGLTYQVRFGFSPTPDPLISRNDSIWNKFTNPGRAGAQIPSYTEKGVSWQVRRTAHPIQSANPAGPLPINIFLQDGIAGDWTASVKVSIDGHAPAATGATGLGFHSGLILQETRNNFVALTLDTTADTTRIRFYHVSNLANTPAERTATLVNLNGTGVPYDGKTEVYLMLTKLGRTVTAEYSEDGKTWLPAAGDGSATLQMNDSYIFPSIGFYSNLGANLAAGHDNRHVMFSNFTYVPITSIKIDSLSIATMARGEARAFTVKLNPGASDENIIWTVANPLLGYVDDYGNVTIFDKTGNVRLTATDPDSGLSHSITLRIAS